MPNARALPGAPAGRGRLVARGGQSRLSVRPRPGLFLGALAIVLAALFLPGFIGAVLVGLIVLAMAWIMVLTWSVTAPRTRAVRSPPASRR